MNAPDQLLPPHSVEAEQSVLGGLLLDNAAWDKIADMMAEADFYRFDHRLIYRHISKLIEHAKPADAITVAEALQNSGELQNVGGLAYLGALAQNTPSAANIRRYAEIVRERSMLRQLQTIAADLHIACADPAGRTAEQCAAEAESSMLKTMDRHTGEPSTLDEVFKDAIAYVDERARSGGGMAGLPTGFRDFDAITGGLEPGQLVIVAARPSVGKSLFACNVADAVARAGMSVVFFTLEMSRREIGLRLLSARSGVSAHAMRTGVSEDGNWKAMSDQQANAGKQRLYVDDRGAIGVGYVRAKARRIQRQHGLDLVIIDYLGLMTGEGHNRTQEIGSLSRGLKALAKELRVPVVALAQLNRGVENRQDKRPLMSDLRDSGEVEQDADVIAMLHRDPAPEFSGLTELLVRKNRNGPLGDILLRYSPEVMTFSDYGGPSPRADIARRQVTEKTAANYRNKGFSG